MKAASHRHIAAVLGIAVLLSAVAPALAASGKVRIPVGEFTARRMDKAPTIDGELSEGEWDGALTTSGMMTVFSHKMLEAATTMSIGFDDEKLYFAVDCTRGNNEWRLRKTARENDDYSFGDSSIEIWVTPPTPVPETYQNIINTFPAVQDVRNIPSRGYSAMGWSGDWTLGVTENEDRYIIEASIPIEDFGFETIEGGDVWRFLICRTAPGTQPRAQASWSVTQAFSEIPQHPKVHFMDDTALLQVYNVTSIFTGKFDFPMAVVAPKGAPAEIDVLMRIQKEILPADDDKIIRKHFSLKANERKEFTLSGDVTAMKEGYFTLSATTGDGKDIFRQSFPFNVNGFVHETPKRPDNAAPPAELAVNAMYGPENDVLMAKADIIDLPQRDEVAKAVLKVTDPASGKVLQEGEMPVFRNYYSNGHMILDKVREPVWDTRKVAYIRRQNANIEKENQKLIKQGKEPKPLKPLPEKEYKTVNVEVAVMDADGNVLKTATDEVKLIRYQFEWMDNKVGVSDEVIPPWTPVTYENRTVGVWNRNMRVNGLGLLEKVDNGGTDQIDSMRLIAVADGKKTEIAAGAPKLARQVDDHVTLTGEGSGAGLKLSAKTRYDFDGFALSDLTIAPAGESAKVDKLYLEVVLPESEATHFCTTSGGWAAVHDVTPEYWSSQQTASGMLIGDFVPYVWLTNSDRAFVWLADNDKGWITDDDKSLPTQEIIRKDGKVTLRVNFIEMPSELTEPTELTYGYQTFPSRPLPDGWRTIICNQGTTNLPSAKNTYFWFTDGADWAVLWPYYCSPYPWSMEKSRAGFSRWPKDTNHRPCPGSIAHAIARYRDYEGNQFPELVVDWGSTPGNRSNGNTTQGEGPVGFRVWHYQRWVREGDMRGLYIDENYLALEDNFLTGGAYIRDDGQLQRGYSYLGLREYYKRMKKMYYANGVPEPNLWMHISSGAAYFAWWGDIFFEGENVEPTNLEYDYIEVLPAGRMRAIASAKTAGGAMTVMCQSQRHATQWEPKHTHQFVGWVMAHDVLPEQVRWYEIMAQEARFYEADVEFIGYWKDDCPVSTDTPECIASVHKQPDRSLVWVVNTARQDQTVDLKIDFGKLGLDKGRTIAVNAETGEQMAWSGGGLAIPVLKRDFVAVQLVQREKLSGDQTFVATFDDGEPVADEALGCEVFQPAGGRSRGEQIAVLGGAEGGGIEPNVLFWPRLHLTDSAGALAFQAKLADGVQGTLLGAGLVQVKVNRTQEGPTVEMTSDLNDVTVDSKGRRVRAKDKEKIKSVSAPATAGWREFELTWANGQVTLKIDGKAVGTLRCHGDAFGIGEAPGPAILSASRFLFGTGATAYDDIRCSRPLD